MALKDLVVSVQTKLSSLELSQAETRNVIDTVLESIAEQAAEGSVRIPNFGTFKTKVHPARPARTGRNPSTGEPLELPATEAKSYLAFKQAKVA